MTAQRWVQIEELFHRVIESEPHQRAQVLEEAGQSDPELRREVEALLSSRGSAGDHLREAVRKGGESALAASTVASSEAAPESIIGPYHLVKLIGEGGMGEVWLAEQKHPVRRRVAVKLIKAGMDTREVVRRFGSERQALALMDHPAIAKVFDAGSTSQGHPYFVMECVAGVPITEYCDKHKLTTRDRLELFIHVCEGVQHAHQKAIIHRDLKPSNILVSEVDGKPMPRIIDFGVAKAVSQPLTGATMYTRAGAIVGTPGYMSPEQADSAGEDIDTRTDVYSLGVVLYELLVGALPLDFQKLPLDEILRRLREQDAPKPSTKLRTLGPVSTTAAQNRRTDPLTLARQLRGDLDAITLKALEKDRSRRYGSPSELAADIARHLRHEPVVARPANTLYRARKYVRRHRIGVGAVIAFVLLLAAAAIGQTVQLRRVTRERDRADRITNFMTSMFKVSSPSEARGNKVTARELLDKASRDIDTSLASDPQLQAQMMHVMGTVYRNLGLYSRADSLVTRAVEIRHRVLGANDPATLESKSELSRVIVREGRFKEAEKLQRETLEIQRRVLGSKRLAVLASMENLATIFAYEAKYSDAEKMYRETLDVQRQVLGPEDPQTLTSMGNLAVTLNDEGRHAEAEKLYRETLDIMRRVLGPDHPNTLVATMDLASCISDQGRKVEAENLYRQALDVMRRVLGPNHPDTIWCLYNLAVIAANKGHTDEALSLLREAVGNGGAARLDVEIERTPEFKPLQGDPRFAALLADAKQKAVAAAKAN